MQLESFVKGLLLGSGAAVGMSLANRLGQDGYGSPRSALREDARQYEWRHGRIVYRVAGPEAGQPLLLLHGIYATASGWEMRRAHEHFQASYRVYTPDLLGFGASEHPAVAYDDQLYVQLVVDFTRDVIGRPTAAIASRSSAAFAIAAAATHPELFGALVLIEPTGVRQLAREPGPAGILVSATLRSDVLGEFLFRLLTSKPSIQWFLRTQGYRDQAAITEEVVEAHYNDSHQPNARFAPAAFAAGQLNRDVRDEFAALQQPILLVWGYESTVTPVQNATAFLKVNPRAEIIGFNSRSLPHDEVAPAFAAEVGGWLKQHWPPQRA